MPCVHSHNSGYQTRPKPQSRCRDGPHNIKGYNHPHQRECIEICNTLPTCNQSVNSLVKLAPTRRSWSVLLCTAATVSLLITSRACNPWCTFGGLNNGITALSAWMPALLFTDTPTICEPIFTNQHKDGHTTLPNVQQTTPGLGHCPEKCKQHTHHENHATRNLVRPETGKETALCAVRHTRSL